MKNKAALFGLYLPIFVLFTIVACAIRTAALLLDFDYISGYFNDSMLINIADYIALAGTLILFSFIINGKKNVKLIPEFSGTKTLVSSVLTIGALGFLLADSVRKLVNNVYGESIAKWALIATAVFAVICILYFVFNILLDSRYSRARANLALFSTFFFAAYSAYLYFNTALPLNAPNKLVDEMAYLFTAAFFLFETRLSLGRAKWRGYIAFGFVATIICAYSSVPSLIYYMVENKLASDSIYESVLTFALFIFIATRTLTTGELLNDKVSPKAQLIIDAANERITAITQNQPAVNENDEERLENQISLSEIADIDKTEEDYINAEKEEQKKRELIEKLDLLSTQEDG